MVAADGSAMLALADRSENNCWRSTTEGERFIDAYSQLEAFRYPIDNQIANDYVGNNWRVIFSDRYAFSMQMSKQLEIIQVYDIYSEAARFVDSDLKSVC